MGSGFDFFTSSTQFFTESPVQTFKNTATEPLCEDSKAQAQHTSPTGFSEDARTGTSNFDSEEDEGDSEIEERTDDDLSDSDSEEEFSWVVNKTLTEPRMMVDRKLLPKNMPAGHQIMNACGIFQLFFPSSVMAVIVEETNRYADDKSKYN